MASSSRSSPSAAERFPYRIKVKNHEGHSWDFVDPYFFGPLLTRFRPAPAGRRNALSQL